jgi:hypothetical protein
LRATGDDHERLRSLPAGRRRDVAVAYQHRDLALDLALARVLNMPQPLVHAAGLFVFLQVQAFENSVLKALCPKRLMRRLLASCRRAR